MLLLAAAGLHPDAIGRSLVNGPNELLTETLPLTGTGASLAAPLVLTWLCGAGTTELVTRRPRWQPGLPGIGLAIPLATYVLAYAVTSSRPGRTDVVAPLLFMTLIAVTLVRQAARLSLTRQAGVGPAVEDGARSPLWRAAVGRRRHRRPRGIGPGRGDPVVARHVEDRGLVEPPRRRWRRRV